MNGDHHYTDNTSVTIIAVYHVNVCDHFWTRKLEVVPPYDTVTKI